MGVPTVEDLVGQVRLWQGRAVSWTRLTGGLSHHIFRVEVDGIPYVLRILDRDVSRAGLGIPPEQEIANTARAAETGVGAAVHEVLPEAPALVLEYVAGATLGIDDVRRPELIPALAGACRRLHAGAPFGNDFDIFTKRDELLDICRRHDLPLPAGYLDREPVVERLRAALEASRLPPVPCHNDLLAENFLSVDNGQVRIVDYQLSGNNDPAFELGDIAAEADYDPDLVGRLATAYFDSELDPTLLARIRLYLTASNVTWTLWFTVHHGLLSNETPSFDYEQEAADKWGQATRDLDAADLGRLLEAAARRRVSTPPP
jgi:thiamine kinase-like enzyme